MSDMMITQQVDVVWIDHIDMSCVVLARDIETMGDDARTWHEAREAMQQAVGKAPGSGLFSLAKAGRYQDGDKWIGADLITRDYGLFSGEPR